MYLTLTFVGWSIIISTLANYILIPLVININLGQEYFITLNLS